MRTPVKVIKLGIVALLVGLISCHPAITVQNLKIQPELEDNALVVFLEVEQNLPQDSIVKVGDYNNEELLLKSKNDVYNSILSAKKLARENGANVIKAFVSGKGDAKYNLQFFKFDGNLNALGNTKIHIKEQARDTTYKYIYLNECSLATDLPVRRWCAELSIRRAIIQQYAFPEITDSTSFENRETYKLNITLTSDLKVSNLSLEGCSNKTIEENILKAFKAANLLFVQQKGAIKLASYQLQVRLRSMSFLAKSTGEDGAHPQAPMEISEDILLNSILKNTYQK